MTKRRTDEPGDAVRDPGAPDANADGVDDRQQPATETQTLADPSRPAASTDPRLAHDPNRPNELHPNALNARHPNDVGLHPNDVERPPNELLRPDGARVAGEPRPLSDARRDRVGNALPERRRADRPDRRGAPAELNDRKRDLSGSAAKTVREAAEVFRQAILEQTFHDDSQAPALDLVRVATDLAVRVIEAE